MRASAFWRTWTRRSSTAERPARTRSESTCPISSEQLLYVARAELPDASFHADDERRFDYRGDTYTTEWPLADEKGWKFFRLPEGTLATSVVEKAKDADSMQPACLRFDLAAYQGGRLADVEPLRGNAGWVRVAKLRVKTPAVTREHLVLAVCRRWRGNSSGNHRAPVGGAGENLGAQAACARSGYQGGRGGRRKEMFVRPRSRMRRGWRPKATSSTITPRTWSEPSRRRSRHSRRKSGRRRRRCAARPCQWPTSSMRSAGSARSKPARQAEGRVFRPAGADPGRSRRDARPDSGKPETRTDPDRPCSRSDGRSNDE